MSPIHEASLFCLVEHLEWRQTMSVAAYAALRDFARAFGIRASAQRTTYQIDTPPSA